VDEAAALPGFGGWFHLVFFGLLIPWAAWKSRHRLERGPLPPRPKHFLAVIVQLSLFLFISLWVARAEGIDLTRLPRPGWAPWGLAAVLLAAGIVLMKPRWRKGVERRERKLHLFMPRNGRERALWFGVSAAAGLSEEVTYRGVMFVVLAGVTGSAVMAAVIASVIFGVSHVVQGWQSVVIVVGIALALHGLVAVSGSLLPAIVIHAVYDAVAGLAYGRIGEEMNYPVDGIPLADPPAGRGGAPAAATGG
jgi:membrane protease YdiL (CAAX protease family)